MDPAELYISMKSSVALLLASVAWASAQTAHESEPSLAEIREAAATTQPYSPVSFVPGRAFDRFYQVWLENIVCLACLARTLCFLRLIRHLPRTTKTPPPMRISSGWPLRVFF